MRSALSRWLKFRDLNDRVLAGQVATRVPQAYAQRVVATSRDMSIEQDLATQLHALLEVVMPGAQLPSPDVGTNPAAAVQLARLALTGDSAVSSPAATGGFLSATGTPWLWPVLIVGGLLIVATTAIKSAADVAKDREEKACIQAGACTDYGFWIKIGGIAAIAWFAWEKAGVKRYFTRGD